MPNINAQGEGFVPLNVTITKCRALESQHCLMTKVRVMMTLAVIKMLSVCSSSRAQQMLDFLAVTGWGEPEGHRLQMVELAAYHLMYCPDECNYHPSDSDAFDKALELLHGLPDAALKDISELLVAAPYGGQASWGEGGGAGGKDDHTALMGCREDLAALGCWMLSDGDIRVSEEMCR
jgi:hypothetical protein